MSRTLTAGALAKIAVAQGIEPSNIVQIEFVPGTSVNYSDKPTSLGIGRLLSLSEVDDVVNIRGSRATTSVSVKLDDHDGLFRSYMDQYDLHNCPVRIYQHFEGLSPTDSFLLFSGRIESPIVWVESDHTVSFEVVSQIYAGEVGFSPEEGQFTSVRDDLVGQIWPLCFGGVIHVPAVEVRDVQTGKLLTEFGLPDATLVHKIRLINLYLSNISYVYAYYYQAQIIALALAKAPLAIQDEFMDRIILEDQTKQTREDLMLIHTFHNKEFDRRAAMYQVAQYATIAEALAKGSTAENSREYWSDELEKQRIIRKLIRDQIVTANENLDYLKVLKQMSEIDAENSKYVFDFVGDLREKMVSLIKQYFELEQDLIEHQIAYLQQTTLWTTQLLISDGYLFPQATTVIININQLLLQGYFTGNVFTITSYYPTYTSIPLDARQNDNPANFWLTDANTNLQGMYALTDSGHIIKITSQDQEMCTIQLLTKDDVEREQETFLDDGPGNIAQIKTALDQLLTGNETNAQLLEIASQIPKDISRYAWQKLQGTLFNTQVLTGKYLGGGTFTVNYDEYTSAPIAYNIDAQGFKDVLLQFPMFAHLSSTTPKIEVTGGPLDENDIIIVFRTDLWIDDDDPHPRVMHPLIADQANLTGIVAKQTVTGTEVNPFFPTNSQYTMEYDGNSVNIEYANTLQNIKTKLQSIKNSADFTVRGTQIYFDNDQGICFKYGEYIIEHKRGEPFILTAGNKLVVVDTTKTPMLWAYRASDGAREYTVNEQARLLFDEFEKDVNYPALSELKKQMVKLFKAMNTATNQADRQDLQQMLAGKMNLYINEARYINIPEKAIEEAFRLISDQEYKLLFEMQLLHYIDWKRSTRPILADVKLNTTNYQYTAFDFTELVQVAPAILPSWLATLPSYNDLTFMTVMRSLVENQVIVNQIGDNVALVGDYQQKYVANTIPSTVHAVYAYRTINGIDLLVPVPSRYYTKNESDTSYNPLQTTTITLKQPLSRYENEFWKEGIYVTLTSSVGPNVVDIMEWIIGHYTNLNVDTTSFNSVKTALTNYPANFALFEKKNALTMLEEMAWQSRCAIWINGNTAFLRYLSVEPNSVHTLNDGNVEQGSLQLTFTPMDDLITRLTCSWKPHYAVKRPNKVILRHNLAKYPEIGEDTDFYIYTNRDLVVKSATFWIIRKANIWKKCRLTAALDSMTVETLDCVLLDFASPYFAHTGVKGIVESAKLNTEEDGIDMDIWLPVKAGSMIVYDFAWPGSVSINDIFPEDDLVISGNAGSGFNAKVPRNVNYDPTNPDDLEFRPKDYGDIKPSDDGDTPPANTASEFVEKDYKIQQIFELTNPTITSLNKKEEDPRFTGTNFREHVNENIQRALGRKSYYVGYGRIIGKSDVGKTVAYTGADGESLESEAEYYDVQLLDSRVIQVRQLSRLHEDEELPPELYVHVTFEGGLGEYVMNVPTDIGGENPYVEIA